MTIRLRSLLLLLLFTTSIAFGDEPVLKIESNPVIQSILAESNHLGTAPEIYLTAEHYRLDLSLMDLIDQVTLLTVDQSDLSSRLKKAYESSPTNPFLAWIKELDKIAAENPALKKKLDKELRLQSYSTSGAAIQPEYQFIDLDKIRDNALLVRIHRYNTLAQDGEGAGLLSVFEKVPHSPFFTPALTVAKLEKISRKDLRHLRKTYYQELAKLYEKHDPDSLFDYHPATGKFKASKINFSSAPQLKIFNILAALPNKQEILLYLAGEIPEIPRENGLIILTPSFIEAKHDAIVTALKNYTRNQVVHSPDDEYLLGLRRWIKENLSTIHREITTYNSSHGTNLALFYTNPKKLPRRTEAILDHEILLKIYQELPWISREYGTLFDKKGRERFIGFGMDHPHSHLFKRLAREAFQTENYLSVLVGTSALLLTHGNVPLAMSVQKVTKDAIETIRYDHEWKEFLKDVPSDVLDAFVTGTGLSAGRLYKILALGAGRGAMQSLVTGEDLKTGAAFGMTYNFIANYIVPTKVSRPMSGGFDAKSLRMNRRLELLEGAVRAGLQGTTVSLIEGEPIFRGLIKGMSYGTLSTQLKIWMLGTRYNPFKDYSDASIDYTIDLENQFQNKVGRGGEYAINRQLILDANYRVGGILPEVMKASVTYPGNVMMGNEGFKSLTTLTHEASHLMQQEQSGVFGFYLFRYLPAYFRTGYDGHPDENFLTIVAGNN